jgi:hypothetical protein
MGKMLFTTVAFAAILAAGPACHNNKPKIVTSPAIENVRKVDTMGDAEKKLQIVPKKVDESKARAQDSVVEQSIQKLSSGGQSRKPDLIPPKPVSRPKAQPITD